MRIFMMQCKYEIVRVLRNRYFVFWSLAMPILFYYIFTNVVNSNVPNKAEWQAHYLMSMTVFSVMGSSIMTLGIRKVQESSQGWSKFMRIMPVSDTVYFAAQMVGQSVVHLLSIFVIFSAGAIINDVSLTPIQWVECGVWILFGSVPFLAIGTLIGTMRKVETASGVSNLIYMMLAIAGGMWMPLEVMPKMMQNIGSWLPSYHYGNGAWQIIRGEAPEWKNFLMLVFFLIVFMLLSNYIRRKQEAV